jgi:hypothetical protein
MGAGGVGLRAVGRRVGLPAGQDAMNGPPRAAQARADGARRPSAQSGRDTCAQASAWHGPRNTLRLERQPLRPFSRLINRGGQGFPPHRRFFACVLILDQRKNCPARCAPSLSLSLLKCCHERRLCQRWSAQPRFRQATPSAAAPAALRRSSSRPVLSMCVAPRAAGKQLIPFSAMNCGR